MKEGSPSRTSITSAVWRWLHMLVDDDPKLLYDVMAPFFFDSDVAQEMRTTWDSLLSRRRNNVRGLHVFRHHYAESELIRAAERGVSQYVILGAGMDSFAYRCPPALRQLHVFEIDHPSTQAWKRGRLAQAGVEVPGNLTYVAVDFQTQSLAELLQAKTFRSERAAFVAWLGVTYYLTEDAVLSALEFLCSNMAPGSEVVFDFILDPTLLGDQSELTQTLHYVAERDEPWLSFFDPQWLQASLMAMGFAEVIYLGAEEVNLRFFGGRADGLMVPDWFGLMKARLGGP